MTDAEKLVLVKEQLNITDSELDTKLSAYLSMAAQEILSWYYTNRGGVPANATVPYKYEITQVQAVVIGYSQYGAEGEIAHNENGIHRRFRYENMVAYIRANVYPLIGI